MKKTLSAILTLVLCGTMLLTVFAADQTVDQDTQDPKTGETQVTFNVDPTYTVTIPAAITLDKDESDGIRYIGSGTIKANAGLRLHEGKKVEVRLTTCDYKLETAVSSDYKLPYTV
ncbi:hypothetical protein [Faecalicatena orotica]|uniref:hypothetical protein n=1 Tax=Faecalicatena orotica TaxID=1544 RepID=UPI003216C8C2